MPMTGVGLSYLLKPNRFILEETRIDVDILAGDVSFVILLGY
jgi:hypothetical protein